ncbi:MAG: BadF/BadG/BcrA/BcrD ATPase family protein, partial [Deltaproteobacteria bacterium]
MKKGYLGVDVGSVSTNLVVLDENGGLLIKKYLRTNGKPIQTVQEGLYEIGQEIGQDIEIAGAGTTGSARYLISLIIGADIVKNEITAHAIAASSID